MCFALFFPRYTPQKTYVTFVPYVFFTILAPFITQAPLRVERTFHSAPAAPVQWVQRVQVFCVTQCPNIMGNSVYYSELPIFSELRSVNVLFSIFLYQLSISNYQFSILGKGVIPFQAPCSLAPAHHHSSPFRFRPHPPPGGCTHLPSLQGGAGGRLSDNWSGP